jgi:hypothetical protein
MTVESKGGKMKRTILILVAVLLSLIAVPAQAQAVPHHNDFTWVASTSTGVASYNIYRAPCTSAVTLSACTEGTFAKIGSVAAPTVTYSDTTTSAGLSYSYYVTAVCPTTGCQVDAVTGAIKVGGESGPSNHIAALTPSDKPISPTNLALTTVARNSNGANTTITASWIDTPGTTTTYTISAGGTVLTTGWVNNVAGNYSTSWGGKVKPGLAVTFKVCDTTGACDSRTI